MGRRRYYGGACTCIPEDECHPFHPRHAECHEIREKHGSYEWSDGDHGTLVWKDAEPDSYELRPTHRSHESLHRFVCDRWDAWLPQPGGEGIPGQKAFLAPGKAQAKWLAEVSPYTWPLDSQVARGARKRIVRDAAWWRTHESGAAARKRHAKWLKTVRPTESEVHDTWHPLIQKARKLEAMAEHADAEEVAGLTAAWKELHRQYWAPDPGGFQPKSISGRGGGENP